MRAPREYIKFHKFDDRKSVFPIPKQRQEIWDLYKIAQISYWIPQEIRLHDDSDHFKRLLTERQKGALVYIIAFFAVFDSIVNANIIERLLNLLKMKEANAFLCQQMAMETIHGEMYSIFVDVLARDEVEKDKLLNSIEHVPAVGAMAQWADKWMKDDETELPTLLLGALMMEAIFFAGCFAIIFWFQNKGLMPGLGAANRLISRDEYQHAMFLIMMYNMIDKDARLDEKQVHEFVNEAVVLACNFMADAMPEPMPEMNYDLMCEYLQNLANVNLGRLHYAPLYKDVRNPFPYMEQIDLPVKNNNHERQTVMYGKAAESAHSGASGVKKSWLETDF
jgi:ribonucleotide reductase beta subunit family protein with ferritin-like domain